MSPPQLAAISSPIKVINTLKIKYTLSSMLEISK